MALCGRASESWKRSQPVHCTFSIRVNILAGRDLGLSNDERGRFQYSWTQLGGQESWRSCWCWSCCGPLWSPRPQLLSPSEMQVWDYLYIPNHFRFISLSPSPRQHQCTLLIVLPLREQKQESDYFLEIKNELGRNLIITGVSLLQKWVKIVKTSISYPPLFISTSEIAPSELEASQV